MMQTIQDESRLCGKCDQFFTPENISQLQDLVRQAALSHTAITVVGGRTGVVGGCVPAGGFAVSLDHFRQIDFPAKDRVYAQAGVRLGDLLQAIEKHSRYRLAPDPSEEGASVGGLFASNASGTNAAVHGRFSRHVKTLWWLESGGEVWQIHRGDFLFAGGRCPLPDGKVLEAGHMIQDGSDLIDFLAGTEGLLGIVLAVELTLLPPLPQSGVACFFQNETEAAEFVRLLTGNPSLSTALQACEWIDSASLELLRTERENYQALGNLPPLPSDAQAAVLAVTAAEAEEQEELLLSLYEGFLEAGGREEDAWSFEGLADLRRLRALRHAVPELIHRELALCAAELPGLCKLGTDFTNSMTPEEYQRDIATSGLKGFVYGHLREGHLHCDLLAQNADQIQTAQLLMEKWAERTVLEGGKLFSENGMGRLKREMARKWLPAEICHGWQRVKTQLDPQGVFKGKEIF